VVSTPPKSQITASIIMPCLKQMYWRAASTNYQLEPVRSGAWRHAPRGLLLRR
jgi:hypothetical protein